MGHDNSPQEVVAFVGGLDRDEAKGDQTLLEALAARGKVVRKRDGFV
jgi:hypothetical protein